MSTVKKLHEKLLEAETLKNKGRAYRIECQLAHHSDKIDSWKFKEWDYGKPNVQLPCQARGLFLTQDKENPKIVARGYDKFFNIGEVAHTKMSWINENTEGPYEVTVKANGCIIFIAGLEDGSLVVCSKHSTGPRDDINRNHAEAGETFLLDQLAKMNIDPKVLGLELFSKSLTAVAEYCDDLFEEHVLEYKDESRGLYLHGLNMNTPNFHTLPFTEINNFAKKYGFKATDFVIKNSLDELHDFLNDCKEKGSYNGDDVEGFVIRCHLKDENNSAFFFKYKFEEPYLMYRQWREVTRKYIEDKSRTFKFRKHSFITNKYLDFVIPILNNDPKLCEQYMIGFGIIELRNKFLESLGMSGLEILNNKKMQQLELEHSQKLNMIDEKTKFLIFPISVIGCGKTTVAMTLNNLFPNTWGHIQNDDIYGKNDKSLLIKKSLELLAKPEIKCVFVDRNNHQIRERQTLFDWVKKYKEHYMPYDTNIQIIGISFAPSNKLDLIKDVTANRILQRGDNHQTIKLTKLGNKKTMGILSGFWKRYQPINLNRSPDDLFDMVVELDFTSDKDCSLRSTKKIVNDLAEKYPVLISEQIDESEIRSAFDKALNFKLSSAEAEKDSKDSKSSKFGKKNKLKDGKANNKKNEKKKSNKPKELSPVYFELMVSVKQIRTAIDTLIMQNLGKIDAKSMKQIRSLFVKNKFQEEFHITLCHINQFKKGTDKEKAIWNKYMSHYQDVLNIYKKDDVKDVPKELKTGETIRFKLVQLVWDEKIVSIMVEFLEKDDGTFFIEADSGIVEGFQCGNKCPHITIGVLDDKTKPFYSNALLERVINNDTEHKFNSVEFKNSIEYEGEVYIHL